MTRRMGLGLAAIGRPGYINLGHGTDLPAQRTVEALRERAHALLDEAYAAGVRYFDAARSYGRAEEFLGQWLDAHPGRDDVVVGSKWGYTYAAGWRVDAEVHEVKDHSVETYDRQIAETRALLGRHLNLYQIHSLTPESSALRDTTLHERLARLAADGVTIGFSTSGPDQAAVIREALRIEVAGVRLFGSVQSTWNVLEPSAGGALAEAYRQGCQVIVKEAMANGRLAGRETGPGTEVLTAIAGELGTTPDEVALAAVLQQPWATRVLSGAVTAGQLASNLHAEEITLEPGQVERLATLAEPAAGYWRHRSELAWA
ncbi:aldo/keto reductase [Actinoplanes sp. TBRC 11911]|uniref:aldo/keto reductase n=1 Tax=Actinoplanes sp. TBRC 11911 TaxID=2729386 RepID=UPI00145D7133|nr:aldo/keto reductase [Actinoplanes sp. TBRC 11911]NMO55875.1 aldo/keto reductase [Actinoplanes sp. TBRC 11911]